MSYQFDPARLRSSGNVKIDPSVLTVRRLARRTNRQQRRALRAI